MRFKLILVVLLLVLLVCGGCNFKEEKLIYQNSEEVSGSLITTNYLTKDKVALITEENLEQAKSKFRGLQNLKLNQETAIYITLGECPTGGYQILIQEIRKQGSQLKVFVEAAEPKDDTFVTQVITYPHDIVKVPTIDISSVEKINFIMAQDKEIQLIRD